jgi:glycosyltransferase involved in cell wall biosynthesis
MIRLALIGDGNSPHLLKWARALRDKVDLWAVSSRGFDIGFNALMPLDRRLALCTQPDFAGGNFGLLRHLPEVSAWLREAQPDWLAPHYLSSHGSLAWLATRVGRVQARIAGSAWGSDILVAPERSAAMRFVTRRVLKACELTTSDSEHMADRMRALGAREVMVFPFGLESLPAASPAKDERLFFANRGLEPIYRPDRVLDAFASIAAAWPDAHLVVANEGSLRPALEARAQAADLAGRVRFVGRLDATAQAGWYGRARWYMSLPESDSVSVSVLEAMGHGCIPIVSDLPANRELVHDGRNGVVLADGEWPTPARLAPLAGRADQISAALRAWVGVHAMFPASVGAYVKRLEALTRPRPAR